jgi:hypothetical protein
MLLFTLGIVLWILIPFYDIEQGIGPARARAHYFGLLAVFALLATTGHRLLDDSVRKRTST